MTSDNEERLIKEVAGEAARKAVHDVFRLFGVDIEEQEEINYFRDDLVWSRKMRLLSERSARTAFLAITAAIGTGIVTVFWDGIKHLLTGKP
jgi:hypothetical protein